ncbi:MAG TPA: protein kinase [Chondromyces sp.]|nr:protein kinase [Chondromyces sp.]
MNEDVEGLGRRIADALQGERWAEALPLLDLWCGRFPEQASSWLNLGYCLVRLGRFQEAVEAFDSCLALDPANAKALGWRARAAAEAPPPARPEPEASAPRTAPPSEATIAIPDSGRGWMPGTVVAGRYEIQAAARGGMAVVSIAFDRELRRMVAVKTPLPSVLATADGRARFQREAESWIALGIHPNICCAHYLQEIEGLPRLFVEYVDGGDLAQFLRRTDPPSFEARLDIAIQVASGLDYTHSFIWRDDRGVERRGVVHRDIKPANVLLTTGGIARVTDFGLVRAEASADAEAGGDADPAAEWALPHTGRREDTVGSLSWQTVTIAGGLVGTPPYMAPELWRQSQRGTVASDVYAFGCMLYEIFCGRRPFELETDHASQTREQNLGAWMRLHLRSEPPDPCELAPGLPPRLGAVIRSCVARKASLRPQSFALLREWLAEVYAEATGTAYPRPAPQSTQLLADSLNNRGVSFATLDLGERAAAALREALEVHPGHLEATFNRALLEWRDEGLTDAELERRLTGAERGADPERAALLRARMRLLVDRPRGAEELLRGLREAASDPPAVRRELGLALLARARTENDAPAAAEARDLLHEAVRDGPSDLMAVIGLAEACALTGEPEASKEILERARGLDASVPQDLGSASAAHLPGHVVDRTLTLQSPVQSVLPIGDGRVVVRGADGSVVVWNGEDPKPGLRFAVGGPARTGRSMTRRGGTLVACLENGPLSLFDLETGELQRSLRPHPGVAVCVGASADGGSIASGGSDRCLRLWSPVSGECERTLSGHDAFVSALAWHPAGGQIATASADGTLRLWNLEQGRCEQVLQGHRGPVRTVCFSADGARLYSGGQDGAIGVWNPVAGTLVRWLRGHSGAVTALVLAEGSVVGGGEDGTVRSWDEATGRARRLARLANPIQDLAPAGGGAVWVGHGSTVSRLLLPLAGRGRLPLVLAEAASSGELAGREAEFRAQLGDAAAAIADGRMDEAMDALRRARAVPGYEHHLEALSSWNRLLAYYPKGAARALIELARCDAGPTALAGCGVLSDGTLLAAGADGRLRRFDGESGREFPALASADLGLASVAVSGDGGLIAVGGRDGAILCAGVAGGGWLRRFEGHAGGVSALAFTAGGRLFSAGDDGTLRLWPEDEDGLPELLASGRERVLALAASADGRFALSAGWDGQVTVWSLPQRAELQRLEGHAGAVHAVSVSPDCRVAASAGEDGTVRLWDLLGGRGVRVLHGHEGAVRRVLFTPDARFLVSGGKDGTLRVWDLRTGAARQVVEGHAGAIVDLALDRSGGAVVSAGSDSSLRLWFLDWEPEQPEQGGWDERVRPFLEVFLRLREPAGGGAPQWAAAELAELLRDLERRGYGWLAPERVERELRSLARNRDLSRAEEHRQTREIAVRRQRQLRTAPARSALAGLTRNLGLKLAAAVVLAILGVLAIASLRTPDGGQAALSPVLRAEMAVLTRERGERLRRGAALAYQERPTASAAPCSAEALPQDLELVLFAERGPDPPLDPGTPAPDAAFRERYAAAVGCAGRLGGSEAAAAVLERAAAELHPYRLEDLVSVLARIAPAAEPQLEAALGDRSERVRHVASLALFSSGRPSAIEGLLAALRGEELRRAEAASYVLTELVAAGAIDEASAFETVSRLCRSIDPGIRRNAVRALVLFEPTGPARAQLDEALSDGDPDVVRTAEATRAMIRDAKIQRFFGSG